MFGLLRALPIGVQVGLAIAVLGAIGGGYYAWRTSIFNEGVAYERQQQQERDNEAIGRADDARNAVRACRDRGGMWDQQTSQCVGR